MNQQIKTSLGVIIIIIFAVTAGMFVWLAQKNNPIETETQTIKINPVKNQEVKNKANGSVLGECSETDQSAYFEIKEMGVKILVDRSLVSDLDYAYKKDTASFSTKTLEANSKDCDPGGIEPPLGSIRKITNNELGAMSTDQQIFLKSRIIQSSNGINVLYEGPQAVCFDKNYKGNQVQVFSGDLSKYKNCIVVSKN